MDEDERKQLALLAKKLEDDAAFYGDLEYEHIREGGTRLKTTAVAAAYSRAASAVWALALAKGD